MDTTLGEWLNRLRPDFLGRMAGGRWGCMLSFHDPLLDDFIFAYSVAIDAETALEGARQYLAEQRLEQLARISVFETPVKL